MPNSKSAAKSLLTSAKRQVNNKIRKSRIKTSEKQFLTSLESGDMDTAKSSLSSCCSALDKAAKKNVISQNKADRKKSRLSAKLAAAGK